MSFEVDRKLARIEEAIGLRQRRIANQEEQLRAERAALRKVKLAKALILEEQLDVHLVGVGNKEGFWGIVDHLMRRELPVEVARVAEEVMKVRDLGPQREFLGPRLDGNGNGFRVGQGFRANTE